MRHTWKRKNPGDTSATCKRCGLKTKVIRRDALKRPKRKISVQAYFSKDDPQTPKTTMPYCFSA